MNTFGSRGWLVTLAGLALVAGASVGVYGKPPGPPPGAPGHRAQGADPLGGPEVEDLDVPGRGRGLSPDMDRTRGPAGRPQPRQILDVVRSLSDERTPEELRLSEDQSASVRAIAQEFQGEMKRFRSEHAEELASLRREAGLDGGGERRRGGRGGKDEGDAGQQEARQRLRELMSEGPKIEDYQARIWEVLTPEQRELANERLEDARREAFEAEDGERGPEGRRRGGAMGEEGAGEPGGPRMPPPPPSDVMRRLDERLQKLSPEQRERVLKRIERLLEEEASGQRPARRGGN